MLTYWDSEHQSSSCILPPLQFHNLTDWESTVQRVKESSLDVTRASVQEFPDAEDIVKLMESTLAHQRDVLVHAHSLIKDYPNVSC